MRSTQGPAGETGGPRSLSWWHAALVYGAGYALGWGSTAATLDYSITYWLGEEASTPWFFLLVTALLVFVPVPVLGNNPVLMKRLETTVSNSAVPKWYLLCVGITGGWVMGLLSVFGLRSTVSGAWVLVGAAVVVVAGPVLGLWWVTRHKPHPPDPDYDDVMPDPRPPAAPIRIALPDLAATDAFGRRLGSLLFPNAVVALVGPLGAGKTHLTRAVAEGLGIANPAAVTSPTFTLVHEYPARLPIYHFDAYRLNGPNEFLDLGVNEYYEAGGVCLIEWADRVEAALPAERLTIHLTPVDESRRTVEVVGAGEKYKALATALASGGP